MTSPAHHDILYAETSELITDFTFDESVAKVFPDMIERSVPGYRTIIATIGALSQRYAFENSYCYDLGSSLGAATVAMQKNIRHSGCRIIAVDNSPAMSARSRRYIDLSAAAKVKVDLVCADIRDINIRRASMVVLNFTLQFLAIEDRLELLGKVQEGLLPGGVLVLSEKVSLPSKRQQQLHTDMHHAFKKIRGYSDLEISQKRVALENVLMPESLTDHQLRLDMAGFSSNEAWFQYFNFVSICAFK